MAANLNKVFLMGNLTRDPELKYTPQGTAVCKLGIAVNRQYKGADGELKKQVDYFNIVVWGKSGENCGKFLNKGRPVLVEGRLQNHSFETQDKQKRTVTEIVADNVQFLGGSGGPGGGGRGDEGQGTDPGPDRGNEVPDNEGPAGDGGDVPF